MLQYERIDVSEGIYINKSNKSKECMICHHWYKCHDVSMICQRY